MKPSTLLARPSLRRARLARHLPASPQARPAAESLIRGHVDVVAPLCSTPLAARSPAERPTSSSFAHSRRIAAPLLRRRYCSILPEFATGAAPGTMSAADPQDYRLPTDVAPTYYDLTVWTDLENSVFEGVVHIECVVLSPCRRRVVRAVDAIRRPKLN